MIKVISYLFMAIYSFLVVTSGFALLFAICTPVGGGGPQFKTFYEKLLCIILCFLGCVTCFLIAKGLWRRKYYAIKLIISLSLILILWSLVTFFKDKDIGGLIQVFLLLLPVIFFLIPKVKEQFM
jgi:hypothetical protein